MTPPAYATIKIFPTNSTKYSIVEIWITNGSSLGTWWGPGVTPLAGVQGAEPPWKLMGFSTLKVQENLFRRVKFTQSLQVFLASVLIMSSLFYFMLFFFNNMSKKHVCYDVKLKTD